MLGAIIGAIAGYIIAEGVPDRAQAGASVGAMIGLGFAVSRIAKANVTMSTRRTDSELKSGG